uniref:Bm4619 n=1 Tax=Brugia malayi TaxID=6279 RepID=A0A1I9GBR7_BRUMA|nr:Bm4619 [Brugia malayi]
MISSSSGSSADENKTNHSNRKRSTIDHRSVFSSSAFRTKSVYWWKEHGKEEVSNKTNSEEVILSPDLWSKIMKTKSVAKNFKSLVLEILEKQSEEISAEKSEYDYKIKIQHGTTTASTTTTTTDTVTTNIISHGSRGIRSTSDTDLEIIEKPFATTTIFTDYTKMIITNLSSSSSSSTTSEEIVKSLTNESELKVIGTIEHEIRTDNGNNEKFRGLINELNSSIEKLATTAIIGQQATIDKDLEDERFDGTSDDNLNENEITTVAVMVTEGSGEMITNKKLDIPEKNSKEDANKIEQNLASKPVGDCFEVIDGFILKGTAGGLEQDVTLEECQCYCANSR